MVVVVRIKNSEFIRFYAKTQVLHKFRPSLISA